MAELYPDGVERLVDVPYPFMEAVETATRVLHWRENLEDEEVPPRRIWLDADKLTKWFEDVKRNRDAKFGKPDGPGPIEDPVQNEAAKMLVAG